MQVCIHLTLFSNCVVIRPAWNYPAYLINTFLQCSLLMSAQSCALRYVPVPGWGSATGNWYRSELNKKNAPSTIHGYSFNNHHPWPFFSPCPNLFARLSSSPPLLWTADPTDGVFLRVLYFLMTTLVFVFQRLQVVKAKLCFRFCPRVTNKIMPKNVKVAGWCISILHHILGGYSIFIRNYYIKILAMSGFLIAVFIGILIWHY